jgi:hypothetical protein
MKHTLAQLELCPAIPTLQASQQFVVVQAVAPKTEINRSWCRPHRVDL